MNELQEKVLLLMQELSDRHEELYTLRIRLSDDEMEEIIKEFGKRFLKDLYKVS